MDAGLASFLGCQQGYLSPGVGVRAAEYDLVQQLFADDVPGQAVQEIGGHCLGIRVDLSYYPVRRVGHASQCVWHAVQVELDGPTPDGPSLDNSLQVLSGQFSLAPVGRRVVRSLMDICRLFPIIIIRLGVLFDAGGR